MAFKSIKLEEKDLASLFHKDSSRSLFFHWLKRSLVSLVSLGLLFAFFFGLINLSALTKRWRYEAKGQVPAVVNVPTPEPEINYSPQIEIAKIGVSAPVIMNIATENIIPELKGGVVHYAETALPGQAGNSVIVGHSSDYPWSDGRYKNIFALLDKLVNGDPITLYFGSQKLTYTVIESKIVKPTEVSVLAKTDRPVLTLVTCYPVGTSRNRLIIRAELSEGKITGVQENQPDIGNLPTAR